LQRCQGRPANLIGFNPSSMQDYHIPLFPDKTYHILSHAVGTEILFKQPDNYCFFLERFEKHCSSVLETLSYCLLPNHFHFLVRIKSIEIIQQPLHHVKHNKHLLPEIAPDFIRERVSNF
jgi:hypothetical protein